MKYLSQILTSITTLLIILTHSVSAQIGPVIWEENFNDLNNWIIETGNGSFGWGNGELQYYSANNVSIDPVPGEPGNNALHIVAKQETGPGIVDQWGNPLNYTSGRVNTNSKISIKYGLIEARVQVPDLNLGGWPAVWLLGTTNYGWPRKGEIDMMEMGHAKAFRDLHDTHNGGNGLDNSSVNQMVGSNAIFFTDAAVNPGNPSGAASLSYDPNDQFVRPYYNYSSPLVNRFLIYRTYWSPDSLRFTVIDNGVEYDLYAAAFPIDAEAEEFTKPFYLIANLAVGGFFTDGQNLSGTGSPISMGFPADMYVDYIKVSQWNGYGEVNVGPPTFQNGVFGLFTDNTPSTNQLNIGVDAEIFVWEGTLTDAVIPPYEGPNGIAWSSTGKGWFGAGIFSEQPVNLFNFGNGNLKFRIKIPANVSFKIGIIDQWGNQNYVSFPANQTTYGLVRDGNWGQACIPISDLRGLLIDLRMLTYEFVILEENGTPATFALDDIYWEDGVTSPTINTSNISYNTATLNWDVDPNAVNHSIVGGEVGGGSVSLNVGNVNSFNVSGLEPGRSYYWSVIYDLGSGGFFQVMPYDTFTTLSCDPPTGLFTNNISTTGAKLNWNTAENASKYQIYGSAVGSSSITTLNINNPATAQFQASGLPSATSFQWAMTSFCPGYGYSGLSGISAFTTLNASSKLVQADDVLISSNLNQIKVNSLVEKISSLELYDASGKMIYSLRPDHNEAIVDMSSLSKGIYIVKIVAGEKQITKKVIH